jgi:Cd2+/Zn2+-exporting ATPase
LKLINFPPISISFKKAIARVNRIAFDKTGTLTKGNFKLLHLRGWNPSFSRKEVFQYLHAMEANASHPLAVALVAAAKSEEAHIPDQWTIEDHENLDGEGVTAQINGKEVYVGNMRLFDRLGLLSLVPNEEVNMAKEWMQNGCTVGFLSVEGVGIVGSYCVADAVRPEARDVISSLHKLNIEPVMLTGDNAKAALHIGNSVGFHMDNIKSQLLPHEKLDYIKEVVAESEDNFPKNKFCSMRRRQDLILMCGDGVNDAPALTMADVGVAMGAGAAIAMESADATLLDSDLRKLLTLIKLSKRVSRTIIENVVFSCLTKAMVMGFTFAGYHSLWAAIAVDVGAMLIVTLNGMKLLPSKKSIRNQTGYDAKRIENNGDLEDQLSMPLI